MKVRELIAELSGVDTAEDLIRIGMAIEADHGGFLRCIYCGATNAENDPPEDDDIEHEADCDGARLTPRGPIVHGEQFPLGYTPEAAAYEQATRRLS